MKVRIKNAPGIECPAYQTAGACGFDFRAVEDVTFAPGEWKTINTGTVVETPPGYMLMLAPRSSTYKNHGLILSCSIVVVDNDYCGNNDRIKFPYVNISGKTQIIEKWTRIGQWVFVKIERADFEEVDEMSAPDRGGFGSTGKK